MTFAEFPNKVYHFRRLYIYYVLEEILCMSPLDYHLNPVFGGED